MTNIPLPLELWRRILEEATSPPGGLVTSWEYNPVERLFRGWEDIEFGDPEIQTKLAIVLVCKRWKEMGNEFLYQWVKLIGPERTREVGDLFRSSAPLVVAESDHVEATLSLESPRSAHTSTSALKRPAYGWWVKRVDIAGVMTTEANIDETISFLELCSQVEVVFHIPPFGSASDDHAYRLKSFEAKRFHRSLRHLSLRIPR